jgi:hypothetical protein
MQSWYLIIGIGLLLILTSIINGIAESIERAARERQIKILRYKRSVDNLTDFLSNLSNFDLPEEISKLLQNEILARLMQIQNIDKSFHGIDDLITQSKNQDEDAYNAEENFDINNLTEPEFQTKLAQLRKFTKYINELPLISSENKLTKKDYHTILLVYRFEKISQFYSKEAQLAVQDNDFNHAGRYIDMITGAIAVSGFIHARLSELNSQAITFSEEIDQRGKQYQQEQDELRRQQEEEQEEEQEEQSKNND